MMLAILLSLIVCMASAANETGTVSSNETVSSPVFEAQWKNIVDEAVLSISMGPLNADFEPSKLAGRDMSVVLRSQASRLRAWIVGIVFFTFDKSVTIDIPTYYSTHAIDSVLTELRNRKFDIDQDDRKIVIKNLPPPKL
jgi:hypothetical protein